MKNSIEIRQRIVAVLTECATVPMRAAHIAGFPLQPAQKQAIDAAMARMEQGLTDPDGLPGRGWYKH